MRAEIFIFVVLLIIALVSLLGIISEVNKQYSVETPAFGGTLREGIVGAPRFINPLLAQNDTDRDLVTLIYAGLLRYDENGVAQPALAERYDISEDGLEYIVTLKNNLYWQDGENLTADDVLFTIQMAKNPQVGSPRRANWEGVEVEKIDLLTIKFSLKKPYAPFLENLTLGIIPKHLWEDIPVSQFSIVELNTNPIGAGPYKIKSASKDAIGSIFFLELSANSYFVLGKPHIKTLDIKFYKNEELILSDLKNGAIDSAGGVSYEYISELDKNTYQIKTVNLQRIIALFLNQNSKKEFASIDVRRALDAAIDKKNLVETVLGGYGEAINGPLPSSLFNKSTTTQGIVTFNPDLAQSLIQKQKKPLIFTLTTSQSPELIGAAEALKKMWEKIDVKVEIKTFGTEDLEPLVIGPRRYEAFLYGEEVVGQTPDPFAFWHSSQRAHPGYNIALYANSKVDTLLEKVRSTQDPEARINIYADIQKEITKDIPAVFLFSPSYIYVLPAGIGGVGVNNINTGSERFSTIHNWYFEKHYVWKIFI